MKILHLTLKKKWFDLIASGDKIIEYREFKSYWIRRLIDNVYVANVTPAYKIFDEVHFRNGYRPDSPFMRVVHCGVRIVTSRLHKAVNGEILKGDRQFTIFLGEILEIKNWN